MKLRSFSASAVLVALSTLMSVSVSAAPVTWTLNDVTFGDGGKVSGSFVFDADTNAYLSWDIVSTATLYAYVNGYESLNGAAYTTNSYNPHTSGSYLNPNGFIFYATDPKLGFPTDLILNFAAPLTDAGGVIALKSVGEGQGFNNRITATGPYANGGTPGYVASVPEPSGIALAASALFAFLLIRRSKLDN